MIEPPKTARQTAITISLGTKVRVCSLIEVAAWNMPRMRPATSAGIRIGAQASARIQSACCATPMRASPSTALASREGGGERAHGQRPAVDEHEQKQLERHRDDGRRE